MKFVLAALALILSLSSQVSGATVQFFNPSQVAETVSVGTNVDTIRSNGYVFSYTRDKLFTGGLSGGPIGRSVRVPWPEGVEAQSISEGPSAPGKPKITIQRVDNTAFDITAFTAKLLGNTWATGASIEVMPKVNGEDAFANPVTFLASGSYGQSFSFDGSTPTYLGNTSLLKGYQAYDFTIFVDFALTALTLEGQPVPEPASLALLPVLGLLLRRVR